MSTRANSASAVPADPAVVAAGSKALRSPHDEQRIALALEQHFDSVWRSLRRLGVHESDADDAAQHVFLQLSQRIATVEIGRERPYLLGIAVRVAANARRKQARTAEDPSEELEHTASNSRDPESLLDHEQRKQRLDVALATLPDEQRQVFVLYELEGFSLPEIARTLLIPLGTATSRLRRARQAFEAWVDEHLSPRGAP
jgi:RNA polymerase sigma-70 factor, ECF subfamily